LAACGIAWLTAAWPLVLFLVVLLLLRPLVWRRRLAAAGPDAPDVASLGALLEEGRYRGVPVREEAAGAYGGGRWVPGAGEIRLAEGMLTRCDVDALMILAHERTHAEHDWPAPRWYRTGLVGLFLVALALGWNGRLPFGLAVGLMVAAYLAALGHVLRNEWIASAGALRLAHDWPAGARRAAWTRLAAAYGVYLAEWAGLGLVVVAAVGLVACAR
jgi:hypothetical protein